MFLVGYLKEEKNTIAKQKKILIMSLQAEQFTAPQLSQLTQANGEKIIEVQNDDYSNEDQSQIGEVLSTPTMTRTTRSPKRRLLERRPITNWRSFVNTYNDEVPRKHQTRGKCTTQIQHLQ
ncbi:hypothetical protein QE152_g39885 [Popillia japonica]|uniref:Uncharacterized protein n=1 Tax=Popillia japonica TaxID=7064 RepID=A0AAW1HSS5_POPJA